VSLPSLLNMSEVVIEKVAIALRCTCGHLWLSASRSKYPTCPRCHSTISRKKHAVILESETKRNEAASQSESEKAANRNGENYGDIRGRSQ